MARIIVYIYIYIYSIYAPSRTSESQGLSFTCSNLDWAFTCYFKRYPAIFGLKKGFGPSQWWLCLSLPGEFRGRGVFDIGEWFLLTDKSSQISPEGGFWHPMFYFRDFKVFRFFLGGSWLLVFPSFFRGFSMILPGNAMDVFHVVSQLARKSSKDTITEERMLKAPNWITIVDWCWLIGF